MFARAGSDGAWSPDERVEARAHLEWKLRTGALMVRNQQDLRDLAGEILALLREEE